MDDNNNNTVSTQHGDNKFNDNSSSSNDGSDGRGMPEKRERTAAEIRKSNKPLMEKRRRERINSCLDQLKSILMEVTKKERSYYSKLEKADILEMTVKYLKNLKRQQMTVAMASDPSVLSKYMAGFNECTSEVTKYLNSVDGMTPDMSTRLLGHLASCLQHGSATAASAGPSGVTTGNMALQLAAINQHCALGMPSTTPLSVLPGMSGGSNGVRLLHPSSLSSIAVQTVAASPMQLVSAKLPGGELILVLHNPQLTPDGGSVCQPPAAENASAVCTGSSPPKRVLPPAHASASATCSAAVATETLTPRSNEMVSPSKKNCGRPPEMLPSANNVSVKKEDTNRTCRAGTEDSDDDVDDEDDSLYEEDNSREPDRTVWRPW